MPYSAVVKTELIIIMDIPGNQNHALNMHSYIHILDIKDIEVSGGIKIMKKLCGICKAYYVTQNQFQMVSLTAWQLKVSCILSTT